MAMPRFAKTAFGPYFLRRLAARPLASPTGVCRRPAQRRLRPPQYLRRLPDSSLSTPSGQTLVARMWCRECALLLAQSQPTESKLEKTGEENQTFPARGWDVPGLGTQSRCHIRST